MARFSRKERNHAATETGDCVRFVIEEERRVMGNDIICVDLLFCTRNYEMFSKD